MSNEQESSSIKDARKQNSSSRKKSIDEITPDSTTVSADNVPFSQDYQDKDREVPGFDDLALDDDNEENGSDNSDSDDENLADQSFPDGSDYDDFDNENEGTNLFVVDALGTTEFAHVERNTEQKVGRFEDENKEHYEEKKNIPPNKNVKNINHTLLPENRALIQINGYIDFCFQGTLRIKVLRGVISCQGYNIKPSTEFTNIYSPKFYSALSLKLVKSGVEVPETLESFLKSLSGLKNRPNISPNCAVALIERHSEPWIDYLTRSSRYLTDAFYMLKEVTDSLGKQIEIKIIKNDDQCKQIWTEGQGWEIPFRSMETTQKNGQQPKLICIGGKGVGKSSFLRWCQNQNLNAGNKCLYLDLDPGQREFGLPCYLSLCLVDKPVLGPSICQPKPEWILNVFFGDISPASQPDRYLKCVDMLLKEAKKYKQYPLLINTMGWVQGLGLQLNIEIIKRLKPTTVVQFQSRKSKSNNAPCSLTPNLVMDRRTTWTRKSVELSYAFINIGVATEEFSLGAFRQSASLREINLLAWMGRFKPLSYMPVYSISYSSVALHVIHERVPNQGLLAAMAGRFVDLCHMPEDEIVRCKQIEEYYSILATSPLVPSLGVGLIRSVDGEKKKIYLTSYLPEKELEQVNCLVGGKLELPSVILKREQKGPHTSQVKNMEHPLERNWSH